MPTRTVKHRTFPYRVEVPNYQDPEKTRFSMRTARRGQTIEVTEADARRGDALGAFYSDEEMDAIESGEPEEGDKDVASMAHEELVEYLQSEKPTAPDTVALAQGRADLAQRILAAETEATGGHPRATVVRGLEAVVARSNQ